MAFRSINFNHLARFNSATSSEFLDIYNKIVEDRILKESAEPSTKTFAPSSFRCDRKCWFRLRGTMPDVPSVPDVGLEFRSEIGTACHQYIQRNLVQGLQTVDAGVEWVDVEEYLQSIHFGDTYEYRVEKNGYETMVEITKPYPIRFSVDGILRIRGEYYLFEVKTAEHSTFEDLTDPKEQHIAQVTSYCAFLLLRRVLFLYQDRAYGDIKVYEVEITETAKNDVFTKMDHILFMVEANLAPNRLESKDDPWCKFCEYRIKCAQWG